MTRLMRQASHPIDGCGSLSSSSGVMSSNVRCSGAWTRPNASSRISFAIMRVPPLACAYYKSKVRFKPFKSFNRRNESVREHPYFFLSPSRGKVSSKLQRYAPTFILCGRAQTHESVVTKRTKATFPSFENSRNVERIRLVGGHLSPASSADGAAADGPSRTA
jgi:hypothetical protein